MVGLAGLATFAAAPGCAEDQTMLYVRAIVPPTKGCGFDGSVDANVVALTWGMLDWSCKKEYSANILIANTMQRNPSNELRRTEANRVQIQTIEVNAILPGGAVVAYDLPATAVIEPADGTTPGYAVVGVPLLPFRKIEFSRIPGTGLVKQVDFEIRVRGKTLGGNEVTSAPFLFPVRIGEGILGAVGGDAGATGTCTGQDFSYADPATCPQPGQ
jgi:hypothetical protein